MAKQREQNGELSADRMVIAMRETAARLNGIIHSAMDAIITVDENQDIVIFNPAAERMFGCDAADVMHTPLDQFIPARFRGLHRQHIERFAATGVTSRRMGATSQIIALRGDGAEFPVEASISQVTVGGKKLFSVILRDVTQRQQTEQALRDSAERYQRLVELVPDAIWIERDERIAFVNRACLRLLGAESVAQLLGRSPLDFVHPEFRSLAIERRERLLADRQRSAYIEKKIVPLVGEHRDVEIAETLFQDETGIGVLVVLHDITERKAAEQELHQSRTQLRALSAALHAAREEEQQRIARELHDELGQMLTAMKMDITAIQRAVEPGQQVIAGRAQDIALLLERTVTAVRRIATELRPLMLDDLGLVPTIGWLARDFAKRTQLKVETSLPEGELDIDPMLATVFFRVLQESLTNVAKHSEATRVQISLQCSGADMRLRVADDGRGFDPSAAKDTKTFGLLGMRERAETANGEFQVTSTPGAGTVVEMVVPLQR